MSWVRTSWLWDRDESRGPALDIRERPGSFAKFLFLEEQFVGLEVPKLLGILIEHSERRFGASVQEDHVKDKELLLSTARKGQSGWGRGEGGRGGQEGVPDVEGVLEGARVVDGDALEHADVKEETGDPAIWIDQSELPEVHWPPNPLAHVPCRARHDLACLRLVRQHAGVVPLR